MSWQRVAAIGYAGVETYDLYGHAPKVVQLRLDDLGLELCSSHAPFPAGDAATAILDAYAELAPHARVESGAGGVRDCRRDPARG